MSQQHLSMADLIARAQQLAFTLYDGQLVPHRSCGIAIAQTFGLPSAPYQALRRGGLTGCGECGAIKAGELVLGELLGDPDPTGPPTEALKRAAWRYRALWQQRAVPHSASIICNDLTAPFAEFHSTARHHHCTELASQVAGCVAQVLMEEGVAPPIAPHP